MYSHLGQCSMYAMAAGNSQRGKSKNQTKGPRMNVDEIMRHVGEFGLYQKVIYFIINLLGITHGTRMMIAIFMINTPKHRCAIPSYPNDTYQIQSPEHADQVFRFIPNNTKDAALGPYDRCHLISYAGALNGTGMGQERPTTGCDQWVYDKSIFDNTAVMEFNGVCDESLLGPHSQMAQMAGFLFGVLFFGAIGDQFGRKVSLYSSILVYMAAGFGLSWSPLVGYGLFVFLRFVCGATSAGAYTAACVLSVEMVGPSKRLWVGVLIHLSFGLGGMVLDLIGYLQRDWVYINLIGTTPIVLALSFWWIIPESPRWLAKQGRLKEAEAILRRIARVNGKTFPEFLSTASNATQDGKGVDNAAFQDDSYKAASEEKPKPGNEEEREISNQSNAAATDTGKNRGIWKDFLRMFTFRVLLTRNLVQFLNWFAVSMAYYGLSLTADQLQAGTLYINFFISCVMDIVANVQVLFLLDRWGRRPLHACNMILGGVSCLLGVVSTMVAPHDLQWITVVVAMVGKLGASAGFTLIYIYSSELQPTAVRSAGMGLASAFARLGSILASYIQQWSLEMGGDFGHAQPLLVFGAVSLVAGLMTLTLPETLHKDLPDTVEDALKFGKDPKKDEHIDPVKTVEVFTTGGVEIEMEQFKTPALHSQTSPDPKENGIASEKHNQITTK